MNNKKPLVNVMPFKPVKGTLNEAVTEQTDPVRVSGVLQRAEAKNQNGRIYPKEILKRETEKYRKDRVNQRRALGELDHPDSSVVNLKNVSHNVVSMNWQGNDLVGEIEILSTPAGNILKELFKSNVNVGISSRGMGSVKESADGTLIVDDDFELIAFDFVSNPSTHGAFMEQGQINESFDPHSGHDGKWDRVDNLVSELVKEMSGEYRDER